MDCKCFFVLLAVLFVVALTTANCPHQQFVAKHVACISSSTQSGKVAAEKLARNRYFWFNILNSYQLSLLLLYSYIIFTIFWFSFIIKLNLIYIFLSGAVERHNTINDIFVVVAKQNEVLNNRQNKYFAVVRGNLCAMKMNMFTAYRCTRNGETWSCTSQSYATQMKHRSVNSGHFEYVRN